MRQLDPGVHVRITGSKPNSGDRSRCVFTQREHDYNPHPEWFTDQLREANRGFIDQCRAPKPVRRFTPVLDDDDHTPILMGAGQLREYCLEYNIQSTHISELTGIGKKRVLALWSGRVGFKTSELKKFEKALDVHLTGMKKARNDD